MYNDLHHNAIFFAQSTCVNKGKPGRIFNMTNQGVVVKNWALYHCESGSIKYYKTEIDAENARLLDYADFLQSVTDEEDDDPSFDKYCVFWKIDKINT